MYLGTTDSGDQMQFSVTNSSVAVEDLTSSTVNFSASRQTLASLFLEMTVTSTTGVSGPAVGDHLVGLEFPGVVMIAKPEDVASISTDSPIIAVAKGGVCPGDGTYVYNVVTIPSGTWAVATDDAYSVATLTVTGATIGAAVQSYLANGAKGTASSDVLTCAEGTISDAIGTYITITPSGVLVSSNSNTGAGFVGMLAPGSAVDLSAVANAGEYRGIAGGAASPTQPIGAQHVTGSTEAGDLNGFAYLDVLANTVDYSKVTKVVFGTQLVSNGLVNTGTTATDYTSGTTLLDGTPGSSNTTMIFIVGQAGGKYLLFGIDPSGPGNFLLIQQ
jgi:hypothetical protein